MDFTFGIITSGHNEHNLRIIIDSIKSQNIPNYEIIIVGSCEISGENIINIPFDENKKNSWITKKKNIITQNSNYDNIVFLHDYVVFLPGWYAGQKNSGDLFDVRMDKIINYDGSRFRDWCVWPHNNNEMDAIIKRDCIIPYDILHLSKYMYISGTYWVAKKNIMIEFPLDESLSWGESEDVEWSKRVRSKYNFDMNTLSAVKLLKQKNTVFNIMSDEQAKKLFEL